MPKSLNPRSPTPYEVTPGIESIPLPHTSHPSLYPSPRNDAYTKPQPDVVRIQDRFQVTQKP